MAISKDTLIAYAKYYVPNFHFDSTETVFPSSVDSWLQQCAQGSWSDPNDAHAGTSVVTATPPLTGVSQLIPQGGCAGTPAAGTDQPLSAALPLPVPAGFEPLGPGELFLDFGGWLSLESNQGFVEGNDQYIKSYYAEWFSQLQGLPYADPQGEPQQNALPTTAQISRVPIYCEVAWAGDYPRHCIAAGAMDFAPAVSTSEADLRPDTRMDPFLAITYYLFYPCTQPPPGLSSTVVGSPNALRREGQWEAVSLYFIASPPEAPGTVAGNPIGPATLSLPADPSQRAPLYAVSSQGIVLSGDGKDPSGLSANYPGLISAQTITGPLDVYVTSGTHKNLFSPTPTIEQSDPNQEGLVVGAAAQGVGAGGAGAVLGALAGGLAVGGAATSLTPLGWLLLILALLVMIAGIIVSAVAASGTSSIPTADSAGDVASSTGPALGGSSSVTQEAGDGSAEYTGLTNLQIFASESLSVDLPAPAWWPFPGRWGAYIAGGSELWDSGSFLTDRRGRTRAYWNTVVLQATALVL